MKSLILIASYLWKDTWKRWFEQPSSPAARFVVTGLLVITATGILAAFYILERGVADRLERFGVNTLVLRQAVTPDSKEMIVGGPMADPFEPLLKAGSKVRLRQLFVRANTEWQSSMPVFTYTADALPELAKLIEPRLPILCITESFREHTQFRVRVGRRQFKVETLKPRGWLRPLATEDTLLFPDGVLTDDERVGFVDTTVFERARHGPSIEDTIEAVHTLYRIEDRPAPQIQSALGLLKEWEQLKERQRQWRRVLAGIIGLVLSLVYGAVGVLEFRQNLFVGGLLRSFGASALALYLRHLLENLLIANVAAILGIAALAALHSTVFGAFGVAANLLNLSGANPYLGPEVRLVLLWVNLGALLSSIPIALGLRTPVGRILS